MIVVVGMKKDIVIENKIEQVALLAPFVEGICEELELGPELVFNLNLVLEEAVTNVVMYAYPEGETHQIWLSAEDHNGSLVFTLQDEGAEFDPTVVPEADITLSAEEREIGGLGIFLIRQIMNEVSYQRIDGRNVLTMKKNMEV